MTEEFVLLPSPRRTRVVFSIRGEDGVLEVRVPEGFSRERAAKLVAANPKLIAGLRKRVEEREDRTPEFRFAEGEYFLYLGRWYPVKFSRRLLEFDDEAFLVPAGDEAAVRASLEKLYRKIALRELSERTAALASRFELKFDTVKINAATGRWGSCSREGVLNFSWRLIQCPPEVVDYVVIHELAHLVELNHSDRFWAEVAKMCPDFSLHRDFLRRNARRFGGWELA